MRIKVLTPLNDAHESASISIHEIDQMPAVGDVLVLEGGQAITLERVIPAGDGDPNRCEFVCRAGPSLTIHQARPASHD